MNPTPSNAEQRWEIRCGDPDQESIGGPSTEGHYVEVVPAEALDRAYEALREIADAPLDGDLATVAQIARAALPPETQEGQ